MARVYKLDVKKAWALYSDGAHDEAIAEGCDVGVDTIRNWRKRCGLPANYKPKKMEHLTQLEKDAIAARKAGLTYGEYKSKQACGKL